jgi:hypothetical protein
MPGLIYRNLQFALQLREEDQIKHFMSHINDEHDGHLWVIERLRNLLTLFRHGPRIQLSIVTEPHGVNESMNFTVWDLFDEDFLGEEQYQGEGGDEHYSECFSMKKKVVCDVNFLEETDDWEMLLSDDDTNSTVSCSVDEEQDNNRYEDIENEPVTVPVKNDDESKSRDPVFKRKKEEDFESRTPLQEKKWCVNARERGSEVRKDYSSLSKMEQGNLSSPFSSQNCYNVIDLDDRTNRKIVDTVWELDAKEFEYFESGRWNEVSSEYDQESQSSSNNKQFKAFLSKDQHPICDWEMLYDESDE